MAYARPPKPVMPFACLLISDLKILGDIEEVITGKLGPAVYETEPYEWTYSSYYKSEMGAPLWRKFLFFKRLIDPGSLIELKAWSSGQEERFRRPAEEPIKRRANIDPGYLDRAKVVLASTKNPGHRIYLGKGIYAETALLYHTGTYQPFDYTYRDLKSSVAIAMFNSVRETYLEVLKGIG